MGNCDDTDEFLLCLDSKSGGGRIKIRLPITTDVLCLDSKSGGGRIGGGNPLAKGGLPQLYLFGQRFGLALRGGGALDDE